MKAGRRERKSTTGCEIIVHGLLVLRLRKFGGAYRLPRIPRTRKLPRVLVLFMTVGCVYVQEVCELEGGGK